MKLVVVSDSHGLRGELELLRIKHSDADGFIHCGDSELSAAEVSDYVTVSGNVDYLYNELPEVLLYPIGNTWALITHSHRMSAVNRIEELAQLAKAKNCKYVFYGHTHVFADQTVDGIRIMNPGSLFLSRDRRGKTYGIFEIDEEGNSSFTFMKY